MAEGYVKVLSSILHSSIWGEPDDVVRVWMTMLAMADRNGYVAASIDGIAHMTRTVSEARVAECLELFQNPDPKSRTKEHEGRRLQRVDRGWLILNYKKIRDMHGEESARARKRKWWIDHKATGAAQEPDSSVTVEKTSSGTSSDVPRQNPMDLSSLSEISEKREESARPLDVPLDNPNRREISQSTRRFGQLMAGNAPGDRSDVRQLFDAWKVAFQRTGATLRHKAGDDAVALSECIDAHGLDDCLLVARHAPKDGMVNGTLDERKMKHESIRYIFGNEDAFSRILAAAKKVVEPAKQKTIADYKAMGRL